MGKNKRFTSIDGQSATGAGVSRKTAGHPHIGLFVVADGIDTGSDTLTVLGEVSADDDHFAEVDLGTTQNDNVLEVTEADLKQSDSNADVYVGYVQAHNVPVEYVRANVTSYNDSSGGSFTVTVYVYMTGWNGEGKSYNERTDFA